MTSYFNEAMGRDLGGVRGDGPPKFEVGTAHAYVPPIFGGETLRHKKCPHTHHILPINYSIVVLLIVNAFFKVRPLTDP